MSVYRIAITSFAAYHSLLNQSRAKNLPEHILRFFSASS
jgi:hypothetical protein